MPRTNVCSEITISNIRLAVREVVADFCANPEQTVKSILNAQLKNVVEPVQRLILARLECIYEQLQYCILSPSNEAPVSVLRFLSEYSDESEKDIVRRFENTLSRRHIYGQQQKFGTPSQIAISSTSPAINVPRLENLTSGSTSRKSANNKRRKSTKNLQNSNSLLFLESSSTISSTSSGASLLQPVQETKLNEQELLLSERKSSITSSCSVSEEALQYIRSNGNVNMNDEVLAKIGKANDLLSVVLEEEFVPSFPSIEAKICQTSIDEKSKIPTSLCTSLRSDDDKVTVQYVPTKVLTADAAVSTDLMFMASQPVEKVEVAVNTIVEMVSNMADGSSSSNTTSESPGQLPKRLFDIVLQRPSLKIVSLRPDGSIVPTVNAAFQHCPSVREWTPVGEGNEPKSAIIEVRSVASESDHDYSDKNAAEKLDSVSASTARPDPLEEDLNTLANISPLPHS